MGEIEVYTYESLSSEGKKYRITLTPTIIINDEVITSGKETTEEELEYLVKKAFDASN